MPTFNDITVEATVDLDFEAYCGACGAGICDHVSTRKSRGRGYAQIEVQPCVKCIENAEATLRERIYELEEQLKEMKGASHE